MSNAKNETFDMEIPCQILRGVRASARKISHMRGGDRGSRPSEPREARRAKAEALMIMYFHVVNCLWLLGWFGDVLSCFGGMLLCIFVLESFSRCGRPRARFVEVIFSLGHGLALSNSFVAFRFQLLRFRAPGDLMARPYGKTPTVLEPTG